VNVPCAAFERWLDEGRPEDGAHAHRAHAEVCVRCAKLLELEAALSAPTGVLAPVHFTDAVLNRIHAGPALAARPAQAAPGRLQALLGPAIALTVTAIVLLMLERPLVARLVASLVGGWHGLAWPQAPVSLAALAADAWRPFAVLAANPVVLGGIGIAVAPALLLAAWQLFRWSERWTGAVAARSVPRLAGAAVPL
jgi:hypothetical protein